MQPAEARKGMSCSSQLLDSLKVYLNNKSRLQPIIGLGCIVECVRAGARGREVLYLCEACACRRSEADVRNHITGSLHRYNYIKARHPHLASEWRENTDLSKLAWPLMEKAKILEDKEGPGHVQLLEVEDAVYQMMSAHSENDAVTLINILRGKLDSRSAPVQPERAPIQSQRTVLFGHNRQRRSMKSPRTPVETSEPPPLTQPTVAPSLGSRGGFNMSTSVPDDTLRMESSSSFLDGYTGAHPLIGLSRVVECRGEDGHTYCFLCHCCRVRANKKDVIDHLTSSSHLVNYLMETYPGQAEADIVDNCQLLWSLAEKAEQDEGRGELKVVNAPESLCILLTGKSYHWCVKMLCNGWTNIDIQKRKTPVEAPWNQSTRLTGPSVNETSNQGTPLKCVAGTRMTNAKRRKKSDTVFVRLPLTEGSVLLERTSFSEDSVPVSPTHSPPSDFDFVPSYFQSEDCGWDSDTGSFAVDDAERTTSPLQQGLYSVDADAAHSTGGDGILSRRQEVDGYVSDDENFSQSRYRSRAKDPRTCCGRSYDRWCDSQEGLQPSFERERQNEDPRTPNEWVPSAVPHTQDWPSYHSPYGRVEDGTGRLYNPTSQVSVRVEVSLEEQREMTGNPAQHYNKQQPQYPYVAPDHAGPPAARARQHFLPGEMVPRLDAAWTDVPPHPRESFGSERRHLAQADGPWQTYTEFTSGHVQTASQSSTSQQAVQVGHGVTSDSRYDSRPTAKPDQHFPHIPVLWTPRWS